MKNGDILFCKDGSKVFLKDFDDNNIYIEYKGKIYNRPKSIIGTDLFFYNKDGYDAEGFDEYGINHNLEIKKGSKADVDFVSEKTILYHNTYGEGIFKKFRRGDSSLYIYVLFDVGEKFFVFPDCMKQKFLSFEAPDKLIKQKEFLDTDYGMQEFIKEKLFFEEITKTLDERIGALTRYNEMERFSYMEINDGVYVRNYSDFTEIERNYRIIRNKPYFACIETKNDGKKYIGKQSYGEIIDWADPLCSIYYNFPIYIEQEDIELMLVRDFDIGKGSFVNFFDKYNKTTNTISEDNLLRKIKEQREDKTTHDIINSIRSNQYKILTASVNENIVVEGCAGSGKTMILLHRLHYILRNNKSVSENMIYILSPTSLLITECDELSNVLGINKVAKHSNLSFYNAIIEKSAKKLNVELPNERILIINNETIREDKLKEIYSLDRINNIYDSVYSILYSADKKRDFISKEKEKILKLKYDFVSKNDFNYNETWSNDFYYTYLKAREELRTTSIENVEAILKTIYNEKLNKDTLAYRISILKAFQNNKEILGKITKKYKTVDKNTPNKIYNNSDAFTNTFKFLKSLNFKAENASVKDQYIKFDSEYIQIYERDKCFKKFINGERNIYLYYIISSLIEEEKINDNIQKEVHYEWERFYLAYIMREFSNFSVEDAVLCFIDEFQDYSKEEMRFVQKVFPFAKINYWGDFNQRINGKGISIDDFKKHIMKKEHLSFTINENYRNAKEITEYINSCFNINMIPIGLSGTINELTKEDIKNIDIASDDRVAIIYGDLDELHEVLLILSESGYDYKISNPTNEKIERGIFNILSVQQAKGLEFEKVIVIEKQMSQKQKYVSMTRALNDLYVVK